MTNFDDDAVLECYVDLDGTIVHCNQDATDVLDTLRNFVRGLELGHAGPSAASFQRLIHTALVAHCDDDTKFSWRPLFGDDEMIEEVKRTKRPVHVVRVRRTNAGRVQVWQQTFRPRNAFDAAHEDAFMTGVRAAAECFARMIVNDSYIVESCEDPDLIGEKLVYVADVQAVVEGLTTPPENAQLRHPFVAGIIPLEGLSLAASQEVEVTSNG